MESATASTIPLFHCRALPETLDFYQALGFEITYRQDDPYLYGAVQLGGIALHFANLGVYGARNGIGATLVFVPAVETHHRAFSAGLLARYGAIPTAGVPRIARLRPGQTHFKVFDPGGNLLIFINQDEPDADYGWSEEGLSEMAQAIENAAFLRDTYATDAAAAKVLDAALARHETAAPIDRARALATRAELALALGDAERAASARRELGQIALSEEERTRYRDELQAADDFERWRRGA